MSSQYVVIDSLSFLLAGELHACRSRYRGVQMSELIYESRVVVKPAGDILEITFRGVHAWTHGSDMLQYMVQLRRMDS